MLSNSHSLIGNLLILRIPILIPFLCHKIVVRQPVHNRVHRVQHISRRQTRVRSRTPLLHLLPVRTRHNPHFPTGNRPELLSDRPQDGRIRALIGLHLLRQGPVSAPHRPVGKLLMRFDEDPVVLPDNFHGGDVDGANRRGRIGKGGLALRDLEPEVVNILRPRLDPPGGEGIRGQSGLQPIGEGIRVSETAPVVWV
ncbi:unnamed protein product [Linum tenue]|uniref:Uncharacterized protein n=1 Tax=Linum tenue TaxID=586396 RepID=A0AAV0RQ21_9ROSI|nr:unnamed protein product [Linum tenue]